MKFEQLRNAAAFAGIGLASVAFTGCSVDPGLEYNQPGVVIDREYDDPDIIAVKPIIIDPESWSITIRQCWVPEDEETTCRETTLEVSERYCNDNPVGSELTAAEINALTI